MFYNVEVKYLTKKILSVLMKFKSYIKLLDNIRLVYNLITKSNNIDIIEEINYNKMEKLK
ncbi:hypothetical protein psyc5s11_45400 [Clostridium gelidum]|uniref:Uncharacterized protein n=1 Tax=Clostridium gelidum TaxID=704125 RepID=A0ABN6J5A7_9CLOT|nr:hypothetical protein psyc5s11_45400 [Clostridium gelidum]